MNGADVAVAVGGGPGAPAARACGPLVNAGGPAQAALPGPKRVNVTVPVGDGAPELPVTVAVSEMGLPRVADGVAWVAMVAPAWPTTDVSLAALHGLVAAA